MQKFRITILAFILLGVFAGLAPVVSAAPPGHRKQPPLQESDGYLAVGAGPFIGDTSYRINISDPSTGAAVESELAFPLDTYQLTLEGGCITKDRRGRDLWKISFSFSTDISAASGKLQDSDWLSDAADIALVGTAHPGKDIYSESSVDLNARVYDLRITRNTWVSDSLSLGPFAGYLYQSFDFTARDLHQVGYGPYSPPPPSGFTMTIPGKVLTYEVTYTLPYAGLHTEMPAGDWFRMALDLGYSPWVKAEDEDDHVLRTKKAKGTTSGSAWLASLTAQWSLEDNNSISLKGEYRKINTRGSQTQYWYGNADAPYASAGDVIPGISDRITSSQLSVILLATSRF